MATTPSGEPQWRKSSASLDSGCVEVACVGEGVFVRHSRSPDGPKLCFSRREWKAFLVGVRRGEFDLDGDS